MSSQRSNAFFSLLVFLLLGVIALVLADPSVPRVGRSEQQTREPRIAAEGDLVRLAITVTVKDGGLLIDRPADFPLEARLVSPAFVPGLRDRIIGMREGEARHFTVTSEEAYGDTGRAGIPPGADLTVDVELLGVVEVAD